MKDPRNLEFNKILGEFIVGAYISINTLENPFFTYFIHRFCPIYTLPSRKYFTNKLVPTMESNIDAKIQNILATCNYVSLTSDIWTAPNALTSYISLTLHCVDLNFVKHTAVLACKPMPQAHTGDNVTEVINEMLVQQNIPVEKCFLMITDNASVMLNGVKGAGIESVGCLLHTLHLIVQHSIFTQPGVDNLIKKIKKIVKLHKKSVKEKSIFESVEVDEVILQV